MPAKMPSMPLHPTHLTLVQERFQMSHQFKRLLRLLHLPPMPMRLEFQGMLAPVSLHANQPTSGSLFQQPWRRNVVNATGELSPSSSEVYRHPAMWISRWRSGSCVLQNLESNCLSHMYNVLVSRHNAPGPCWSECRTSQGAATIF